MFHAKFYGCRRAELLGWNQRIGSFDHCLPEAVVHRTELRSDIPTNYSITACASMAILLPQEKIRT